LNFGKILFYFLLALIILIGVFAIWVLSPDIPFSTLIYLLHMR